MLSNQEQEITFSSIFARSSDLKLSTDPRMWLPRIVAHTFTFFEDHLWLSLCGNLYHYTVLHLGETLIQP